MATDPWDRALLLDQYLESSTETLANGSSECLLGTNLRHPLANSYISNALKTRR